MSLEELHRIARLLLEKFRVSAKVMTIDGSAAPVRIVIELPTIVWCTEDGKLIFTEFSRTTMSLYAVELAPVVFGRCDNEKDLEIALEHVLRKKKLQESDINEKIHYTKCSIIITNIQDRVKNFLKRHGIKCQEVEPNVLKCCIE